MNVPKKRRSSRRAGLKTPHRRKKYIGNLIIPGKKCIKSDCFCGGILLPLGFKHGGLDGKRN